MNGEPFHPTQARRLIQRIINDGDVSWTRHALDEMAKDNLTTVDCINVLRGGVVEPAEEIRGTWRYRVCTARIYVVVGFRSETRLVVVTAWRLRT
jgi:hypothetical protein